MWGLQQQVAELRQALIEIQRIALGFSGPPDDSQALNMIIDVAEKALEKQ